jgi:hypothetical protein
MDEAEFVGEAKPLDVMGDNDAHVPSAVLAATFPFPKIPKGVVPPAVSAVLPAERLA